MVPMHRCAPNPTTPVKKMNVPHYRLFRRFSRLGLVSLLAAASFTAFGQVSVYTQNYDNGRSGSNNQETILTPALVKAGSTSFGKLFTLTLDNNVPGMPLILGGLNIAGEPTNILLVQTGSNGNGAGVSSLWAFNADTGTKLWQLSLGSSIGNGSTATPVIDPTVGTDGAIYVMTYKGSLNQLHAIDPIKGIELAGSPVTIAASAGGVAFSNSGQQNTRTALLLFNGVIYFASSHAEDTGTYHGWVIGYKYTAGSGFTLSSAFCDTPAGNAGGIWQGGGGLIADSSSVYAVSGNGSFNANTGGNNYSMSILRLTPAGLAVADWFAPTDEAGHSNGDQDVCGGGMTLIPGTTRIFQGPSKYGSMYLVNTTNLGHFAAPLQGFTGFGTAVGFNPISWDSGSGIYAYVWASGNAINEFSFDTATGQFNPAGAFKKSSFTGGGTLSISSNNGSNGILWATGSGELHAMNPADVSAADYWNSNMNAGDSFTGGGGKYSFSTVANGKVYVATSSSTIVVYGTKGTPPPPPNPPTNLGATSISSSQINLSWTASTTGGVTYSIFRSTTSGFTASNANQIASGVSGTTYSDTGLAASTTYYYLTEAVNAGGASAASNQANATTMPAATCTTVPSAPTGLTATATSSSQINLSWTASTAGPGCSITYDVFSSTTSGFTPSSGNQIATGVSGTSFSDTGLTPSTTYYYLVEAVDSVGSSSPSNQASATTLPPTTGIAINAGGPADGSFVADEDFTGGATIDHANTINTSKVTNPAPAAVYQSARVAATAGAGTTFSYTIGGFTAGSSNTVRLHFCETFWTAAGDRQFNVSINGTQVLTNFDIFATAGGENIANIQQFTEPANASGQYVIVFTSDIDKALISGIEIESTSTPPPPAAPSFSPAPGSYSSAQSVTISDTTAGASIFYTTDGSTPTTSSTAYTGPVSIATTTTLQAIANNSGGSSSVTSGTYTITSSSGPITLQASNLAPTGSGQAISTTADATAPGGTYVKITSTAVGQWIQFTTPSIPAGTYSLSMIYRTAPTRAQHNVTIDGTQVGTTIVDQYAATSSYPPAVTIGSVTFGTAGTHTIRLTATGKNAASTSYQISAVQFIFQ
jgi:Malectin domain/Chitobiase/beta-hexosaminidase C-terminal domain/Fibronectin type III domain/DUF5010 C-terminal domain